MFDKLNAVEQNYEETLARLGTAELQSDPAEYRKQAKSASEMQPLIERFREYKAVARDLAQTEELANAADADMRELAQAEMSREVRPGGTIGAVWRDLAGEFPALTDYERSISAALNADYARMDAEVHDGDEIAFLPPVSGG